MKRTNYDNLTGSWTIIVTISCVINRDSKFVGECFFGAVFFINTTPGGPESSREIWSDLGRCHQFLLPNDGGFLGTNYTTSRILSVGHGVTMHPPKCVIVLLSHHFDHTNNLIQGVENFWRLKKTQVRASKLTETDQTKRRDETTVLTLTQQMLFFAEYRCNMSLCNMMQYVDT
jgi:hypothetical protein